MNSAAMKIEVVRRSGRCSLPVGELAAAVVVIEPGRLRQARRDCRNPNLLSTIARENLVRAASNTIGDRRVSANSRAQPSQKNNKRGK